jgi:hypothetical protein
VWEDFAGAAAGAGAADEEDSLEVLDEEPESESPVDCALLDADEELEPEPPPDCFIAPMMAFLQLSDT